MTDEEIIEKYIDMVRKISNEIYINDNSYSLEDLIQMGCIRLIKAAKKYDPSRGQMSTLLYLAVKRDLIREINKNKLNASQLIEKNFPSYFQSEDIWEYIPDMNESDNNLLKLKIQGFSNKEISSRLSLDLKVVKSRFSKILKRIKKSNA